MSFVGTSRAFEPSTPFAPELQEKIRTRAYELYLLRGQTPGDALQDWLQAEAELTSATVDEPACLAQHRTAKARTTPASASRKKK